jgi:3-oxoadipate enol-lactonase
MGTANGVEDVIGGSVAWRTAGAEQSDVAVFLHGLGGDRFSWEPQLPALADIRRCYAWDLPGYGASTGIIESLPALAELAAQWIAQLSDRPVDVVGLSFGGMVAQHLTLNHPRLVRTLALLATSPAFGIDGVTTAEAWLATRLTPIHDRRPPVDRIATIVDGMVGPDCSAEVRASIVASMHAVPPQSLAAACRALVQHDTRERLHRITVPTLVMVGSEDTETPPSYAAQLATRIPAATFRVVPGVGHIVNLEAPDVVNGELRKLWLSADRAAT